MITLTLCRQCAWYFEDSKLKIRSYLYHPWNSTFNCFSQKINNNKKYGKRFKNSWLKIIHHDKVLVDTKNTFAIIGIISKIHYHLYPTHIQTNIPEKILST
uniref:Uncharacterized protein n=1 Tax=Cacopsylla melanoneura TaxID=428564 RepID=A0A8D8LG65_9HEMI